MRSPVRSSAAAMCNAACRRLTAGGAGLAVLDEAGIACLSAGYMTCRIGDAADALYRGRMSFANETAQSLGCRTGMAVADASSLLVERAARRPDVLSQPTGDRSEQRSLMVGAEPRVWVLDSASLVTAADAGGVVVTGSHGGLVGGLPSRALKVPAAAAVFDVAGGGIDGAGYTTLPALDARGVAAATVASPSARIGDGLSSYEDGVPSAVNKTAASVGSG